MSSDFNITQIEGHSIKNGLIYMSSSRSYRILTTTPLDIFINFDCDSTFSLLTDYGHLLCLHFCMRFELEYICFSYFSLIHSERVNVESTFH